MGEAVIVAGKFSFNHGEQYVKQHFPKLLQEVEKCIVSIDKESHKTKTSKERTMPGKLLYSPSNLNKAFSDILIPQGWKNHKERCDYPTQYYTADYTPKALNSGAFRDMDFVKGKLGVEVQFGKYSFMVYNVCAKMTIFKNLGVIDAGIEIVPVKELAREMSSGVSYFEQFVWDLEKRGVSDIDLPVFIIGIY